MPIPIRPLRSPVLARRAIGATLLVACTWVLVACSNPRASGGAAQDGLVALVAGSASTSLVGWAGSDPVAVPITLPAEPATWISAGRANVLAATLAGGQTATSDPVHLGSPLAWRTVKAVDATGHAPKGPDSFATWDLAGGRFAALAGDLTSGAGIRVVLVDPSAATALEIAIDRPVVPAPPAWIDVDRLVVVTGDASAPVATIVDTSTGALSAGPTGARLIAISADGRRVATMDAQGTPVVIRDTAGWLSGDRSSIGSIAPPDGSSTAIAFALDATGERLVIAWRAGDGSVTLAVHDGGSDWRRVATPKIESARGAVVTWLR